MTLEARTAAAHAVLASVACRDDDEFWTLVRVDETDTGFPADVEAWADRRYADVTLYPKGVLAQFVLGLPIADAAKRFSGVSVGGGFDQ